jgi:hypothetical protein
MLERDRDDREDHIIGYAILFQSDQRIGIDLELVRPPGYQALHDGRWYPHPPHSRDVVVGQCIAASINDLGSAPLRVADGTFVKPQPYNIEGQTKH